jgi:hypothetical protein
MEVALRRRLEGVATVAISQQHQTAEVRFAPGPHVFSAAEFRAAAGEADVEVVSFAIEACGRMEAGDRGDTGATGAAGAGAPGGTGAAVAEVDAARWFVAGPNRFIVGRGSLSGGAACISAALDDRREPYELVRINRMP